MIVRRVELVNFLSHRNTSVELDTGIVAIVGPNGAGKSSIVDAISFTLFGFHSRSEKRSNKQLIRLGAAYASTRVWFEVGGRLYMAERRIYRRERSYAMLYEVLEDGKLKPIARDVRSVEAEIEKLLGIKKEVAKVALIAHQGELAEILESSRRKELVHKLLGLEAIEKTYEKLGSILKGYELRLENVKRQLELYKRQEEKLEEMVRRAEEAEKKLPLLEREEKRLQEHILALRGKRDELQSRLGELRALKSTLDQIEEQVRKLRDEYADVYDALESVKTRIEAVKEQLESSPVIPIIGRAVERGMSLEEALDVLEKLYDALSAVRERYQYYERLKREVEKLEEEARRAERYEEVKRKLEEAEQRILEYNKVKSKIEMLRRHIEQTETELAKLREKLNMYMLEVRKRAAGLLHGLDAPNLTGEEVLKRLQNLAEEYEEKIRLLQETINTLKGEEISLTKKLEEIRDNIEKLASARGRCPLCGRPLSDSERRRLILQLRDEKEAVEERLERIRGEIKRLEEQLNALRDRKARVETALRRISEIHGMIVELRKRMTENEKRLLELRNELRSLHMRAMQLQQFLEEYEKLKRELDETPSPSYIKRVLEEKRSELEELEEQLVEDYSRLQEMLEKLGVGEEVVSKLTPADVREFRSTLMTLQQLEERRNELEARLESISRQMEELLAKRKEVEDKLKEIDVVKKELDDIEEELRKVEAQHREVLREKSVLEAVVEEGERARRELEELRRRIEQLEREKAGLAKLVNDLRRARKALSKEGLPKLIRILAKSIIERHMQEILTHFNIEFMDVRLTEDYDVILVTPDGHEKSFRMLSGGEKTAIALAFRIAFARMLAGRGRINTMILDEPTLFLDEHRKRELINILRYGWRSGSGILPQLILVTHDREVEEAADLIIEVEKVNGVSTVKRVATSTLIGGSS